MSHQNRQLGNSQSSDQIDKHGQSQRQAAYYLQARPGQDHHGTAQAAQQQQQRGQQLSLQSSVRMQQDGPQTRSGEGKVQSSSQEKNVSGSKRVVNKLSGGQFRTGKTAKKTQQLLTEFSIVNGQGAPQQRAGALTVKNSQISKSTGPTARGYALGQTQVLSTDQSSQQQQFPRPVVQARQMNSQNRTGKGKMSANYMTVAQQSQGYLQQPQALVEDGLGQQDQRFRRRLVALAQAQQERGSQPLAAHLAQQSDEARSLEEQRERDGSDAGQEHGRNNLRNQHGEKDIQYNFTNINKSGPMAGALPQAGTARDLQHAQGDQLVVMQERNENLLHSVRNVHQENMRLQDQFEGQRSPRKQGAETYGPGSLGGMTATKASATNSAGGSAPRPTANQQMHGQGTQRRVPLQAQLSGSLQSDSNRRAVFRGKPNQLSGSAENTQRQPPTNQNQHGKGNTIDQQNHHALQGFNRRRQPLLPATNENGGTKQVSTAAALSGETFSSNPFQPIMSQKILPANTLGAQTLAQEIKQINAGLREGQNSQTVLIQAQRESEKVALSAQVRLSAGNKASGTRKPSRGHQKPTLPLNTEKSLATANKMVFSTPALNTDHSAGSLPMGNVIFHPHPLNNNVQAGNVTKMQATQRLTNGNGGAHNGKVNFNATVGSKQPNAVDSARPHSQKQTLAIGQQQHAINNRNSRKNLRPIGKKGSQSGSQQQTKVKGKNPSKEQYQTQQDANQLSKQTVQAHHHLGQYQKGFTSLVSSNGSLNLQLLQNDMSASTSRERALAMGGMNFNSAAAGTQFVGHQPQANVMAKDTYQTNPTALPFQVQGGQTANITNKNVLFKFKKNPQTNRASQQQAAFQGTRPGDMQATNGSAMQSSGGVGPLLQKSNRRGPIIISKNSLTNNQQQVNPGLQNTQPLQFDLISQTGIGQTSSLLSQRSQGHQPQQNGKQAASKTQKMYLPPGITTASQHSGNKQFSGQVYIKNNNGGPTAQQIKIKPPQKPQHQSTNNFSNERRDGTISNHPQHSQYDQLNQLSEIVVGDGNSKIFMKEDSVNPLLPLEPSQQNVGYGNFDGLGGNVNEISSFNEMAGAAGLSSISGIDHIMAEGSQLSRIESSDGPIFNQGREHGRDQPGSVPRQLNQDRSNPVLEGIRVESDIVPAVQAKTLVQSARQSKFSAHPSQNQHFMSTTENAPDGQCSSQRQSGHQHHAQNAKAPQQTDNTSPSNPTTMLGSLTSNFLPQQQKSKAPQQPIRQQNITLSNKNHQQKQTNAQSSSMQSLKSAGANANIQQVYGGSQTVPASQDSSSGIQGPPSNNQLPTQQTATINGKLIKINKSKKMLDTARRSRIKQLDNGAGMHDAHDSSSGIENANRAALDSLNLVALNSNGPPSKLNLDAGLAGGKSSGKSTSAVQTHGAVGLVSSATNNSSKNKQLFGIQAQNFNNTMQNPLQNQSNQASSKKFGALIHNQRQAPSNGSGKGSNKNQSSAGNGYPNNHYLSNAQNSQGLSGAPSAHHGSANKLQLTMNINTSSNQFTGSGDQFQGTKQAHSQKNHAMKLNILTLQSQTANNRPKVPLIGGNAQLPQLASQGGKKLTGGLDQQSTTQAEGNSTAGDQNFSGQGAVQETGFAQAATQSNASTQRQMKSSATSNQAPSSHMQVARSARDAPESMQNNSMQLKQSQGNNATAKLTKSGIGGTSVGDVGMQQTGQISVSNNGNAHLSKNMTRGQIFKKQISKQEGSTEQLRNRQDSNDGKGRQDVYRPQVEAPNASAAAVKIENQLQEQMKQNLNRDSGSGRREGEANTNEVGLPLPAQSELEGNQATASKGNNEPNIVIQVQHNDKDELSEIQEDTQKHEESETRQPRHQPVPQAKKLLKLQNKITDQRTTMDTNSNRKQTTDSQQRTNFNTSMQNIPRGLINTAFSLSSVTSKDEAIPPLPTTPQNILRYYIQELTDYEKGEILDYDMIYFLGNSRKKKVDTKAQSTDKAGAQDQQQSSCSTQEKDKKDDSSKENQFTHNYGYDDEKGDYKIIVGDHIGYRYEIVEFLGKGSFGTALGCIDHKEKAEVAVKIVKNKKKYYYQASVELKILQYLRQHDHEDIMNVIHIEDYVVFRKHLCMAFEKLSMNLFEFLKINDFNGFDHNLIRRFAIQLLYALKYLKQLEIIHCDLKPENILLKEENKSGIKIIDFGSSTFVDEKVYTYIQSRFYRAPEIMLGIPYTTAIDMWSLGCIMAELYIGYPLFPGESENDQMSRIMEMRDAPPKDVLAVSERKMKFFTQKKDATQQLEPIMLKNSRGKLRKPNGKPLDYVIGDEDPDFNDFVIRCLDWNPETRLTPDDALKHVWVLKGLPPQVLIHHQKMHNITTPELPKSVKVARDEFLVEQQREQELIMQQQQRITRAQRQGNKDMDTNRDISHNPGAGRPQIHLKTPRSNLKNNTSNNNHPKSAGKSHNTDSQERHKSNAGASALPNVHHQLNLGPVGGQFNIKQSNMPHAQHSSRPTDGQHRTLGGQQQLAAQSGPRRKFVVKKANKADN